MKVILLSGGKGKRLWPVSTDTIPKQFIKVFSDESSMLSKTYNLVLSNTSKNDIYVATGKEYKEEIKHEINISNNIILEPDYIGTFGAILNVSVYLKEVEKCSDDEIVSVVPVDHNVDKDFYNNLYTAASEIKDSKSDICLIGIKPTFPSEQYGYILHENNKVIKFEEKPNEDKAIELINSNALWNSGIVVFKLKSIIDIVKKYYEYVDYDDFLNNYSNLPKNSFDKEVLEKRKDLSIIICNNSWNDLGTWEILAPMISKPDRYNTNIINFESKEIVNDGIKDAIIINSSNGLKIIPKNKNNLVYRNWGYYEVISDFTSNDLYFRIKKLTILPNNNISYQYHNDRGENWFILNGEGEIIINDEMKRTKEGDIFHIEKQKKHSIRALSKLTILEIQYSHKKISEDEIVRIETEWEKIMKIIR